MKRASEPALNLCKTALDCPRVSHKIQKKSRNSFSDLCFKLSADLAQKSGTDWGINPSHLVRGLDGKLP